MIQKVFRDEAVSAAQIKVWHKHFKDGRESIESDPCSEGLQHAEHLRMWKVYRVQSTKISNWLRELEADLGIPNTTVSEILMQDLGMKHIVAKFVPWLLLPEQKEHRATVANDAAKNCVRSQGAYFEGDWSIIVLSTMFLVFCIFLNNCLYFS